MDGCQDNEQVLTSNPLRGALKPNLTIMAITSGNSKGQELGSTLHWGVYYMPTKEGRIFAGLKPELVEEFDNKDDAFMMCEHYNQCGALDEMHYGYDVKAVHH